MPEEAPPALMYIISTHIPHFYSILHLFLTTSHFVIIIIIITITSITTKRTTIKTAPKAVKPPSRGAEKCSCPTELMMTCRSSIVHGAPGLRPQQHERCRSVRGVRLLQPGRDAGASSSCGARRHRAAWSLASSFDVRTDRLWKRLRVVKRAEER